MRINQQSRAREQAVSSGRIGLEQNRSLTVTAQSGFTMMEIAICLAVIGIALVAIIGVLPIGLNVQQSNRQQTIIGQDATVFMEAVRNGSLGLNDLTNYVYAISNYWAEFDTLNNGGKVLDSGSNWYTYQAAVVDPDYLKEVNIPLGSYERELTNGANIVGLMSTPEFTFDNGNLAAGVIYPNNVIYSNHVVVYCRSVSGPAIEKPPQDNPILQQDSFSYRLFCVNAPDAVNTNDYLNNNLPGIQSDDQMVNALHDLRLTFLWPQLPNGHLGSGRETFRTEIAGELAHQPLLILNKFNLPINSVWYNSNLWCYLPESFTNSP
ncbi:MAG: type IV pilus modification PilV family protein [Limisphaerales bacterium]